MFHKLLIANRGEIACRIITTAKRLGVRTVAIYSDADAHSKHVDLADEAVHIGPPDVAQSYLQADQIIAAAKAIGADAIHPGYGFLSENPDFAAAIADAGLIFVGPPTHAISAMGLKDAAKTLMQNAGVPVVPGYHGADQDPALLAAEADKIGFPVLIKARAGGGGKGMRLVETAKNFDTALKAAQREGQASFGDPACLIEKYITHPRHIEIQIFGDSHGNIVHMFERDCSLQRRHQKVIEEAPAPDMPDNVRAAMGKAAVDAAKAVGYQNAGTVEFIVDGSGPLREDGFWFMEMNTRLQVEHPVSEAITGLDFVELQLRVAASEALPFAQDDLSINGWAMEARVYAEDVARGFLPSTGTLDFLSFPGATTFNNSSIRIDSGVRQHDDISPWYDPMIAKVITHGPTRDAARYMLVTTLENTQIAGTITNLEFLAALAQNPNFASGQVDTGLIARDMDSLIAPTAPDDVIFGLAAIGAMGILPPKRLDAWDALSGTRLWGVAKHTITLIRDDIEHLVRVTIHGDGCFNVNQTSFTLTPHETGWRLDIAEQTRDVNILVQQDTVFVFDQGRCHTFNLVDPHDQHSDTDTGGNGVIAPMPGLVRDVMVQVGDTIAQGDDLLILEAMKMEHRLTAHRDGIVAEILCTQGDQISDGAILVRFKDTDHG